MSHDWAKRPAGSPERRVRSVRCADDIWEPARSRAEAEGVTMSHVLVAALEGYANGQLDLPAIPPEPAPTIKRYTRGELLARQQELLRIRALLLAHDLRAVEDELEDIAFLLGPPDEIATQ